MFVKPESCVSWCPFVTANLLIIVDPPRSGDNVVPMPVLVDGENTLLKAFDLG